MSKITVDAVLRAKLDNLADYIELCDEMGRTLGHYLPEDLYTKLIYAWLKTEGTEEELDRISQEPGGRTLAEIWLSCGT